MMPPTSIDGTDITGATIDGTDVQEITVDGQTVFTAVPPLPSSLFAQYKIDEGSGTTLSDSENNEPNFTLNSTAGWVTNSSYVGGVAYDFSGSEAANLNSSFNFFGTLPWSLALTVNFDSVAANQTFLHINDGSNIVALGTDTTVSGRLVVRNDYGNKISDDVLSTGTNFRIAITVSSGGTLNVYENANLLPGSVSGGVKAFGGAGINLGARDSNGDFGVDGIIDNFIIYNAELSATKVSEDFAAQPWS